MRLFLFGLSLLGLLFAAGQAQAKASLEDSGLVVRNGSCLVFLQYVDGSTSSVPCGQDGWEDEFSDAEWDDFCANGGKLLSPSEYKRFCGFFFGPSSVRLNDHLAFSDIRISLDPSFTFNGSFQRSFLETDSGATNPALGLNVPSAGFELGINVGAKVEYDRFEPLNGNLNVSLGYQAGSASANNLSFPNGIGAPNTGGGVIGAYDNAANALTMANFDFNRTFASLDKRLDIPLGMGEFDFAGLPSIDWRTNAFVGVRGGVLNQHESFYGMTDNNSTVRYNTDILGGFFGAYAGLGLDKAMQLPGTDYLLLESLHVAAGFNNYTLRTTDTLTGTGALAPGGNPQSNTVVTNQTVPTLDVGASVGVGKKDGMKAKLGVGAKTGINPPIGIQRPTSNDLAGLLTITVLQAFQLYSTFSLTVPIR